VEVAPNSIKLVPNNWDKESNRSAIRLKFGLPLDKPIFIYGGNLGKPQGIDFLIKCLDKNKNREDCYFVVIGTGTEYSKLHKWYEDQLNGAGSLCVKVMPGLAKKDYDRLVEGCDVGLIFLDHRFTIPNYPSRLLSYMENKMPVICATDANTDIGEIAEKNGYGFWCESINPEDFTKLVDKVLMSDIKAMGEKGYQYLKENYLVEHTYQAIIKHCM
jgi:glycosyltransferase involved in cell wall biosynthesis